MPHNGKVCLPDHTVVAIGFDKTSETWCAAGVLNSSPFRLAVRAYIVGHPSPHVLKNVMLPRFNPRKTLHRQIAELSEKAHKLAEEEEWEELAEVEEQIDLLVAKLYGITNEELAEIKKCLREISKEDLKTGKLFRR